MLVYIAKEKKTVVIDYREAAPADTPRDVFLTEAGDAVAARSRDSGLGVGVPGTVAGLSLALRKYGSGKFSLAELAAPAVTLARAGLEVSDDLADSLPLRRPGSNAGPRRPGFFYIQMEPRCRAETGSFKLISLPCWRRLGAMASVLSTKGRSRKKSSPASARPGAG